MSNSVREISDYLKKTNINDENALEFLIENNIRTNISHGYIVKKIISQLEVRHHINHFADLLQTQDPSEILRQIVNNQTPTLMKKLIEIYNSKSYEIHIIDANHNLPSPYEQIMLMYDYKEELSLVPQKKRNRFQSFLDKFTKKPVDFANEPPKNKADKIIACQYEIPNQIKEKEEMLASLKWYQIGEKTRLSREIEELQKRKKQYSKEILQYSPTGSITKEKAEVQEWWQNFYCSHEQEMLNYISFFMKTKMKSDLSPEEKHQAILQSMEDYFGSISRIRYKSRKFRKGY